MILTKKPLDFLSALWFWMLYDDSELLRGKTCH